jgi:hypothetical protein
VGRKECDELKHNTRNKEASLTKLQDHLREVTRGVPGGEVDDSPLGLVRVVLGCVYREREMLTMWLIVTANKDVGKQA